MDLALASGIAALREGWTLVAAVHGIEVVEVLVEQSQGGVAVVRRGRVRAPRSRAASTSGARRARVAR